MAQFFTLIGPICLIRLICHKKGGADLRRLFLRFSLLGYSKRSFIPPGSGMVPSHEAGVDHGISVSLGL
jgi:hypothetical protein